MRSKLLYDSIDKMHELLKANKIILTDREKELYDTFSSHGNKSISGSEIDTMTNIYNMFVKYNILNEDSDYKMILVGESKEKNKKITRTLGGIINSKYANTVIVPEYMKLIKWLFSTENLNLRNNTMHGNNTNYDYFGICFPCVMLCLFWDIGTNSIFK